jgi:UDP-sulfoquinovose synthase
MGQSLPIYARRDGRPHTHESSPKVRLVHNDAFIFRSFNHSTMKFYLFLTLPLTTAFTVPAARTYTTPKASTFALSAEVNGVNGSEKKKVIVLGGDGFCGWPTSLYLSDQGHDVVIVDNLSRRNIDTELGCDSLTPIQSPDVS